MKSLKKKKTNFFMVFLILFLSLIIIAGLALSIGAVKIDMKEIIDIIFKGKDTPNKVILMDIRFPRVLLAGIIGAGLATVGAVMQDIFKNPLVDAYTLGMSSGAALGAVISIVTGINVVIFGITTTGVFAFIGAVVTLFGVYGLAYNKNKIDINSLLLAGVAASYFLSSVISFLMMVGHDKIEHIVFWTMGSLSTAAWNKVTIAMVIIIPGIIIFMVLSRELNILSLGEESAHNLGINIKSLKNILFVLCAIMVGCVVSTSGTIGFIGLVSPHIIRILCGSDNRKLIPFSAMTGAILLIGGDLIGRIIIAPVEIPVGIMTSLIGGPFFIFLLRKQKSLRG